MWRPVAVFLVLSNAAGPHRAVAQAGSLEGRVRESWGRGVGIGGARVELLGTSVSVLTDYKGRYRLAALPAGPHAIRVVATGYQSAERSEIPVYLGTQTRQDFFLPSDTMTGVPRVPAAIVDPRSRSADHRQVAPDFSALPITTIEDAVQLWSPAHTFRGGRRGAHTFVLDGIPVVSAYDASTSPLGLRVPTSLLWEATVDFDPWNSGASAATAGVVGLALRDGSADWKGGIRYATDRAFTGSADLGYDRVAGQAEGSLGRARFIGGVDAVGHLQAEPSGAPVGEAGTPAPWALPHNAGETFDGAARVTLPLGTTHTLRLTSVYSRERRELFDPAFKFSTELGDGRGLDATLVAAELTGLGARVGLTARVSYFARTLIEGGLAGPTRPQFGALGGSYDFVGADIARAQDTASARDPIPGYALPTFSTNTPWGVPAFFMDQGSRGVLRWNRYQQFRGGVSVVLAGSQETQLVVDFSGAVAHVSSFERTLAFLPVGDSVPPAASADFSPVTFTMATRFERQLGDGVFTGGLRLDGVSPGAGAGGLRLAVNPYVRIEAPVGGGRVFASIGRTTRFPDLQFLSDVAFEDSLAGGRFRRGGNRLGFESMFWQEFGVGARPWRDGALRVAVYRRRFADLVASSAAGVPDSAEFVNQDVNTVVGLEFTIDKGLAGSAHLVASANVASLDLGGRNGFYRAQRTEHSFRSLLLLARGMVYLRTEGSIVLRFQSGDPVAPIPLAHQGATFAIDALARRSVTVGSVQAWAYLDARNILNHRAGATPRETAIVEGWAQAAYARGPEPIPYDSPRYRASADLDGNGRVEGDAELLPLYRAAARDLSRPLMSYGAPRTVRIGVALDF